MDATAKITCTINQACEMTGLSRTTLYRLLNEDRISSTHLGTKRLVHVDSLRSLLIPSR